jgi:hypothetical protein
MRRAGGLRRAYGVVRPGICSAKVRAGQVGWVAEEAAHPQSQQHVLTADGASARVRS